MTRTRIGLEAVLALAAAATGSVQAASAAELPTPKASHFSRQSRLITNEWFPLIRGSIYIYDGQKDGMSARDVMTVTPKVKRISGIRAAVIHDRLFLNGGLAERTTDWYAQDSH